MNCKIKSLLTAVVLSGMVALAFAQSNIYVATDGDDAANSGQSWASPYATISNGIGHANTAGDTVWVSNGTYVLSAQLSITRAITVSAWSANSADTSIDGNGAVRCVSISAAATLKGFTVSNGMAHGGDGGGIYLQNSSCMVTNCIITLNQANSLDASDYGRGGGIFINSSGGRVSDCLFSNNLCVLTQALYALYLYGGGGLYCDGPSTIANSRFITNMVSKAGSDGTGGGLGISSRSGLSCLLSNCVFDANISPRGGGLYVAGANNSSIRIIDCMFSNNVATNGNSGGIYAQYCLVTNCTIAWNQASSAAGMYMADGATGANCVIKENQADAYDSGAITMGGNVLASLMNSSILNNTNLAGSGGTAGGVFMRNNSLLRNCLIVGNVAAAASAAGGVSYHGTGGSNTIMQNCTVVFNYSPSVGGGLATNNINCIIYYNNAGSYPNWASAGVTQTVIDCCTTPTNGRLLGTGNITNAPLLMDTNSANYRLAKGSPCINTGLNQDWMTNAVDMDDKMRIRYGTVDRGCYEAIYNAFIFTAY